MNNLAIIFSLFIGFYFGLLAGIFLAYKLKQWHDDDRILIDDVDQWIKNQETIE